MFLGVRQLGDCLKTYVWDGLSALFLLSLHSWGFAPGWYGIAPLALKLLRNQSIKGPKARSISAWGNAPGLNRNNESRAESPFHASFETVSLLPPLRVRLIQTLHEGASKLAHSKVPTGRRIDG